MGILFLVDCKEREKTKEVYHVDDIVFNGYRWWCRLCSRRHQEEVVLLSAPWCNAMGFVVVKV